MKLQRVTANCGLRFPMKNLMPKVSNLWSYHGEIWTANPNTGQFGPVFVFVVFISKIGRVMTVWLNKAILLFVIFLDFLSTKQGLPLADAWSHGLESNQRIPIEIHLSNCTPLGIHYSTPDQRVVKSGVTEGGKNTASFHFRVLMSPSTSSRETSGLSGKQD